MEPPALTLVIVLVSFLMSLVQTLLNIKFANPRLVKEISQEVKSFKTELESAKKLGDKRALRALEKRAAYMKQREDKLSSMQLRLTLFSFATSLTVFWALSFFLKLSANAAVLPASLLWGSDFTPINALLWFLISSLYTSIMVRRAFGL
ncbi:MAG: EMC3/TMCO1 family protein [Candidatus Bathyarchaeia archaeon]